MGAKASVASSSRDRPYYSATDVRDPDSSSHVERHGDVSVATSAAASGNSSFSVRRPGSVHHRSNSTYAEGLAEFRQLRHAPRATRGRFFSLGLSPRNDTRTRGGGGSGRLFGDSDSSPDDDSFAGLAQFIHLSHSLPVQLVSLDGIKCPICTKQVPSDDVECHLVMCLTKPRISYNDDVLAADSDECAICLDDMQQGDSIARLPCLCIYHKGCIEEWFRKKQECPKHPAD
ncbi:PREDICTED: E3 ubiquitin-protein ligase znrf1-like [Priapulus caudatus]|uniref:RING-type E3 ubiquitin transferase n=1 Tax=Priapulus caudatus TaxID=37621 RepID=A0ABM1EY05_PRICU|nr:PREDICTED: E3 ubiquitin-protein ligase znrf1-like [Priapulus caudatus]